MEHRDVPIDLGTLAVLRTNWASIQSRLIEKIDAGFGVYEGRSFKADRWAAWLANAGIP